MYGIKSQQEFLTGNTHNAVHQEALMSHINENAARLGIVLAEGLQMTDIPFMNPGRPLDLHSPENIRAIDHKINLAAGLGPPVERAACNG